MGGLSGAAPPLIFFSHPLRPPMELRATQHPPPPHPPPPRALWFSGSPALSIPQFLCRPPPPSLCIPVWGLWDWYVVFGSVLLIFCWMNYFFLLSLSFLIFCHFSVSYFFSPNKIIAIAAVQPASHDFFSVAACCTNQGCSYIFTFCMTKKTTL